VGRLLIINADDFGRTREISAGILKAFSAGVVLSTTAMANFADDRDIEALAESGMAAGLHFNLTAGPPVSVVPREFLNADGEFDRARAENLPLEIVRDELEAQWDYLTGRGLRPTHVDGHHHVHKHARVLGVVIEFALRRGLPVRPCTPGVRSQLAKYGIVHPADFSDAYYGAGKISTADFLRILELSNSDSLEVMCHPGLTSEELADSSSYSAERETELSVLSDPALAGTIQSLGWTIGSYADL
jgi:hypothetical protein